MIEEAVAVAARTALADQGMSAEDAGADGEDFEISIVLADDAFVRELNRTWRNRDQPTNVLSFPAEDEDDHGPRLLGDVVLAYETIEREALASGTPMLDHVTHLVIHGTLHLLGFDHKTEQEAGEMEALEATLLARLDIADPYAPRPALP
ncbi:MAG: rRNA maturation RNase YbeY [Alphaproteobacteria bacterium]|nr:rRNA maturation RNase YbeY [Alphaproteobacteria bacterium]